MEPAFNPYLQPCPPAPEHPVGGQGYIETPGQARNIRWQTRAAAPTAYENALADALEQAYESGASTAQDIVESLNRMNLRTTAGDRWTVANLTSEMAALAR